MRNRFGSWNNALSCGGLTVGKRVNIPRDELVTDVRRVASKLGIQTVTREQYRVHGSFADCTISREFGKSWAAALIAADLAGTGWKRKATDEELFGNMASVWEHVGRQPRQKDFRPPVSQYSHATYINRFGSWRSALEAFVAAATSEHDEVDRGDCEARKAPDIPRKEYRNRTGRDPSWRLRFLVMRRDKYTCCLCGASPAKDPRVSLYIDHIQPWSKGGETIMSNLQTCCQVCNGGKSDLPLQLL